ncbi:hypothetical protein STCU_01096 [Strigomonas culicis]|uniref:RanBP2-type domain-containing protein n=1 Tax=Strigomonas culicis TaxID=28005 RepID=S9V3S0_9TRYP|nr:hypothetical protein STCU_01096 [Strigomonas culicis]|eukprot:EPY35578.1 hypothetical protein STCU_01096 [Strigomonas culicis]
MNFLRSTFADAKLRYRISHLVSDAVARKAPSRSSGGSGNTKKGTESSSTANGGSSTSGAVDATFTECMRVADLHPDLVLHALRDHLSYSHPEMAYGALKLLEYLVSCCSYGFHVVLARQSSLQEKLLQLAVRRTEDDPHRLVQREARLALLEWSRTFADDADLAPLAQLAAVFERRTHKSLMRSLNLLTKRVGFADVRKEDYVMISPKENPGSMTSPSSHRPRPVSLHAAEVWSCPVCSYLNAPSAAKCAGCDTARFAKTEVNAKHAIVLASANGHSVSSDRPSPLPVTHVDPAGDVLQGTAVGSDRSPLDEEDARADGPEDNLRNAVRSEVDVHEKVLCVLNLSSPPLLP